MKSLAELEALRKNALEQIHMRHDRKDGIRIVVGMATCGIAAGARPVLGAFMEEIANRKLSDVTVTQTGCIGVCRLEPVVEVYMPGQEKVTYVKMDAQKAKKVVADHIVIGLVVSEYTIGEVEQ